MSFSLSSEKKQEVVLTFTLNFLLDWFLQPEFQQIFIEHLLCVQQCSSVAETSTRETKHHTQRVGELGFITPAGPEELTLQALNPEQRDYRVFIHRQA